MATSRKSIFTTGWPRHCPGGAGQWPPAGFAAAGSKWAFRRHVLERCDLGYSACMQLLLSVEDWAIWLQQKDEAT